MRKIVKGLIAIFFIAFVAIVPASSESLLVVPASSESLLIITAAYDRENAVVGVAQPGTGPITIMDLSYEVDTEIGSGEVSMHGEFIAVVKVPLVEGNQLIAVDNDGQESYPYTVGTFRRLPAVGDKLE